jgi:hypothetical protein
VICKGHGFFLEKNLGLNYSKTSLEKAINDSASEVIIYDYEYFHPIDEGEVLSSKLQTKAYAVHHWAESWVPYAKLRKLLRKLGIMNVIKAYKAQ